mmetsp:Transcript_23379/g.46699  ORF Transcript_23379/g.46699 Transcript_23379/m.46699 type:complete len:417 (-) Transcript_23379:486-1736(-)
MRRLLVFFGLPAASAWTEDGYPDCSKTAGPACFPNRRAPHHNSLLNSLFNKWCSDKGTYWLSKHNYGAAYDTVLHPIRSRVRNLIELGVGDETAGSLNAWREYFPHADFWIVDIDVARFADKKQFAWATRQKRRHGCFDDANVWTAPRVHPLFGIDSSNRTTLRRLPLPSGVDVIIDDASHALAHQLVALEALWPKLLDGGFYIVEDLTIGALPWMRGAAGADQERRAPSNNSQCGHECHYVQRPAEHPFIKRLVPTMADQRAAQEALSLGPILPQAIERILDNNAWLYSITGAHAGGGLDSTLIIQKTEAGLAKLETVLPGAAAEPRPTPVKLRPLASEPGLAATAAELEKPTATTPESLVPLWSEGFTVHKQFPSVGFPLQLAALLTVFSVTAMYYPRLVGLGRRLMGRSTRQA